MIRPQNLVMATSVLEKTKEKEEIWKKHIDDAKAALKKNLIVKKKIIVECCEHLEQDGMPLSMICNRVMRDLSDFASRGYFFQVIEDKYKDVAKVRTYTKKESGNTVEPKVEKKDTEDEEEEERVIYQIDVETYNIDDLEKYDKKFLQNLVRYLHERVKTLEILTDTKSLHHSLSN